MKLDKINKSLIGKVLRYKELCELFGEEVRTDGKSRNFQKKRFLQVINYEQKGHKYTITEVYEDVLSTIELNIDGKLVGKHKNKNSLDNLSKGRTSPYEDLDLLIYNIIKKEDVDETEVNTDDFIFEYLNIVNVNYNISKSKRVSLSKLIKKDFCLEEDKDVIYKYVYNYITDLDRRMRNMINSSLDRIKDKQLKELDDYKLDEIKNKINNLLKEKMISNHIQKDEVRTNIYVILNSVLLDLEYRDITEELQKESLTRVNKILRKKEIKTDKIKDKVTRGRYNVKVAEENKDEFENIKAIVYTLECWRDKEKFYKIGVTTLSVEDRFSKFGSLLPYRFRIVDEIHSNLYDAILLEKELHDLNEEWSYEPKRKFGGYTECFNKVKNLKIITKEMV